MSAPQHGVRPSIFELLEPLSQALLDNGGPDIRYGFARGTGGVDIAWLVEVLSKPAKIAGDGVLTDDNSRAITDSSAQETSPSDGVCTTRKSSFEEFFDCYLAPICIASGVVGFFLAIMMFGAGS